MERVYSYNPRARTGRQYPRCCCRRQHIDLQSASSLESVQSTSPSQCHASLMHSRDVAQRNWLTAHSVGGRTTPADSLARLSASAAVQFCSSDLSWQSMSPSHRHTSGMHCPVAHCQWSTSHVTGSDIHTRPLVHLFSHRINYKLLQQKNYLLRALLGFSGFL